MNKYDEFFSKLTLVNFTGGAMGSFLINFLTAGDEKLYSMLKQQCNFGIDLNYEWKVTHYFNDFKNVKSEDIDYLKKYYGESSYVLPGLYAHARLMDNNIFNKRSLEFTGQTAIDLTKENFDNIYLPYVKSHPNFGDQWNDTKLPYKDKIFCYFPVNKKWISTCFVIYKHHLHELFQNNKRYNYNTNNIQFISSLPIYARANSTITSLPGYHSIDMYELIFNKNFKDLENIYPKFTPNKTQLELLDMAHTTSLLVLNKLGLSHEINVEDRYLIKEFFNKTGMTKLIDDYLKRIGPEGPI